MPFVLKLVGDETPEVNIYAGTIKIGSKDGCDLVIKSKHILPVHAELYHQMPVYHLAGSHSAFIEINDSEVLKWPVVLADSDIITLGDVKYKFTIIQPVIKRSKKAAFSAYLAFALLVFLLIFELLIMIWLPYKLKESKAWETVTARQFTVRQVDILRSKAKNLNVPDGNQNIERLKKLLQSTVDKTADYLRVYGEKLSLDQAITVRTQLNYINSIIKQWPTLSKQFERDSVLKSKKYIDGLVKSLDKDMNKHLMKNKKMSNA
jgi:hypothetical protein